MTDSGKKGRDRLAAELTLYLGASAAVSLFLYVFLYSMSMTISGNYFQYREIELSGAGRAMLSMWIRNLCVLASTVVFVWLFLFLFAGKVSYLLAITKGIERLRLSRMEGEPIPVEGNDELTTLAEQIEDGRLLMEQMAMEWEASLEERFDCRTELKDCAPFQGNFDVCELQRIFDNLLSNVEKYADPAFSVTLSVRTEERGPLYDGGMGYDNRSPGSL